jgi:quinol monooxygenase YgiN
MGELTVTVQGRIQPGQREAWQQHARQMRTLANEVAGECRTYSYSQSEYDPDQFLLVEEWRSAEAREEYLARLDAQFADRGGRDAPGGWLTESPETTAWEKLDLPLARTAELPFHHGYLIITVETRGATVDLAENQEEARAMQRLTPEGVDGCRSYRNFVDQADPSHLFLFEQWEHEEGLRHHLDLVYWAIERGALVIPPIDPARTTRSRNVWREVSSPWWYDHYTL